MNHNMLLYIYISVVDPVGFVSGSESDKVKKKED